jgi:hypothetical protein
MLRVFSYGGGVQSTAALALAAQGKIGYPTFLFCNVGADSENPETLDYVRDVATPYAKQHGIDLIELHKVLRDGSEDTIFQRLTRPNSRSIGIPVRMSNGSPGNRTCTVDFKIHVCDKWLREQGAKKAGAIVGLGISLDERLRVRYPLTDPETPWKERAYPLVDMRIDRVQCMTIIKSAGLPVPPKSSCYFCPFHRVAVWQEMRQSQPELFQKACDLEEYINKKRAQIGKDQVWLSRGLKPLMQVTTELHQASLFGEDDEMCESGYCFA